MRFLTILILLLALSTAHAQLKLAEDYINTYKDIAISEMHRTGIPASIKLAQGILESNFGQSELAVNSNNHFGIKCHSSWQGEKYYKYDDEFCQEGNKKESCFRVYTDPGKSFYDHSEFLKAKRYAFLYEYDSKDYVNWANGLLKAGYATDPQYANKLIGMIEKYELDRFDESNNSYQDLIADIPPALKKKDDRKQDATIAQSQPSREMEEKDDSIFNIFKKKKKTSGKTDQKDPENEKESLAYVDNSRRNKTKATQSDAFNDDSEYLFDEPLTPVGK